MGCSEQAFWVLGLGSTGVSNEARCVTRRPWAKCPQDKQKGAVKGKIGQKRPSLGNNNDEIAC